MSKTTTIVTMFFNMKKLIAVSLLCLSFCSCIIVDPYLVTYSEPCTQPVYRYYPTPIITTYRPVYIRSYYTPQRYCYSYYQPRYSNYCRK